jgi:ATP-dependent DNA ligase
LLRPEPPRLADDRATPGVLRNPYRGVFDGELVAFGDDGFPSFDRLSRRVLHDVSGISVALVFFDVLEVEGLSRSGRRCRRILV